jgi:hypothetical protein
MCSKPLNAGGVADERVVTLLTELSVTLKGMGEPATLLAGMGSNVKLVGNRLDTVKEARGCDVTTTVLDVPSAMPVGGKSALRENVVPASEVCAVRISAEN